MKIACLGWGSLIWNPGVLVIERHWFEDGPLAPVEFTRKSDDRRITLVIDATAAPIRLLWSLMLVTDVPAAVDNLRVRERILRSRNVPGIGRWEKGNTAPMLIPELPPWAEARGLDAVVWTALGPRFNDQRTSPSAEQIIAHLDSLTGLERAAAEEYVRCAPPQIDTEYRREIEAKLGWTYTECPPSWSGP